MKGKVGGVQSFFLFSMYDWVGTNNTRQTCGGFIAPDLFRLDDRVVVYASFTDFYNEDSTEAVFFSMMCWARFE